MKSCKSVGLYAKEGGVDLHHPPTFAYSPTRLPLFIIWQIMKSGKSVELYAKEMGGRFTLPPDFCIQSDTFATFDNLANYEKLQKCRRACKVGGVGHNNTHAKVSKV